jgi:hypothetical protein
LRNPSFYVHPILHPLWSNLNSKGEVSKQTSTIGSAIEAFWEKWVLAVNRECLKLSEDDRVWMMGTNYEKVTKDTVFVESIPQHPKYPKKHAKEGRRDPDKSKGILMSLWKMNPSKKATEPKKKYSKLQSTMSTQSQQQQSQQKPQENDGLTMVPDTDIAIITSIYDCIKKKNNSKNDDLEKAKNYYEIFKFIYNSEGHPNATSVNGDMRITVSVLGPSINWAINNTPGIAMHTINDMKITRFASNTNSHTISLEKIQEIHRQDEKADSEYGILVNEDVNDDSNDKDDQSQITFDTELERVNYQDQYECKQQILNLEQTVDRLTNQKETELKSGNVNGNTIQFIDHQIMSLNGKKKRKEKEQTDLQQELADIIHQKAKHQQKSQITFDTELERINYQDQQECRQQITDLEQTIDRLTIQKQNELKEVNVNGNAIQFIDHQIISLNGKKKRKNQELIDLQKESEDIIKQKADMITSNNQHDKFYDDGVSNGYDDNVGHISKKTKLNQVKQDNSDIEDEKEDKSDSM